MPPRTRKAATPAPSQPGEVTIEIVKDEGDYVAWLVGAQPCRMTFCKTVTELPDRVSAMLGSAGLRGEIAVTWTGADEAGKKAAKRLNSSTSEKIKTDAT